MRRIGVVVAAVAVLGFLSIHVAKPAWGQKLVRPIKPGPGGPPGVDPGGPTEFSHSLTLAIDPKLNKRLEAAKDLIKEQNWPKVVQLLQGLLDLNREDVFLEVVRKGVDGKKTIDRVGVRMEANRLIGQLPKEGLEYYRQAWGQKAASLLEKAKETGDERMLSTVAISYLHTDAGAEATELLGTRKMDRGDFFFAARYFTQLIDRQGADKLSPLTLFKARLVFRRTKEKDKEKLVAEQLAQKAPDGIKFGERLVSLSELNDIVDQYKDPRQAFQSADAIVCFMASPSRSAQGNGHTPFLEQEWQQTTIISTENNNPARGAITNAINALNGRNEPVLPESFPIAASAEIPDKEGKVRVPLLVYRSYSGIHAVNMKSGKLVWESESEWSLEAMYKAADKSQAISQWVNMFNQAQRPATVLENSVLGSLSTDGQRVYAVDDVAVPPFVQQVFNGWGQPPQPAGKIGEAMAHNRLQAFELGSGKLIWEVGGVSNSDKEKEEKGGELNDTYFLGAPLAMGGKVYVMTERREELRLVCLDAAKGSISWIQTLASTKEKMIYDPDRRSQACHLSYGEGVLVCPTNAGAVIGVDLLSHSLLWAYAYRDKPAEQPNQPNFGRGGFRQPGFPGMPLAQKKWKVSAPVIQDGKVVFTAPDGSSIDCLNLKDGSRLWRNNHIDGDLYMAGVFSGKVVIVGKERTRALNLSDGAGAWVVDTGFPSGRGIASDNIYYLPLKSAFKTKEPEVCAINVLTGEMFHTKSRKKEVPGNLLFYDGAVISQTPSEVVKFPQLKVKLQEIDEAIAKNPDDPVGLTDRGELRLDKGDRAGAVADLRKAMRNNPPANILAKTRLKLFESMTEYLQHNFSEAEKYLGEYEPMCKVEAGPNATPAEKQQAEQETQKRQANFLCLVASGREKQGRLVDAFDYYQKFAAQAAKGQELVSVLDEPAVKAPPAAWARGRIAAMVAHAKPEDRAPLEKRIAASWEEVKKSDDIEKVRQFVDTFGPLFSVGREAEMNLAERLLEQNNKNNLLEAEQHLLRLSGQKDDPQLAARAVETLAKLMARHGLLDDAAACYRILGRDFAKIEVRDGKTGADMYDELATDKRFLPYLDEPASAVAFGGKITAEVRNTAPQAQPQQVYGFEPAGETLPFFQRHKIGLNVNFHMFKLVDRTTGEERWGQNLERTNFIFHLNQYQNYPGHSPRYRYHTVGHLIVLPVDYRVFGIDPVNHKIVWERSLLGSNGNLNPGALQRAWVDPHDDQMVLLYQDGYMQKLGQLGATNPNYVCLLTRDGLVALDPVSGRTLWTRNDVSQKGQLFGDADTVYLAELGTDGKAGGSRAFRASDGVTVKIADFSALYERRIRTIGRHILLTDSKPEATTLRLYDVKEGRDVWTKNFKANAVVLKTEEPDLTGLIEPDGKVTVVDMRTRKDVLRAAIDPSHIKKARSISMLQDNLNIYVAINGPPDPNFGGNGPWSTMQPYTGIRTLPVNGYFYALDRRTGKVRWNSEVSSQMLVLEHFREMPMIMFSSRYQKWNNNAGGRFFSQGESFKSIDKRTGKLLLDQEDVNNNQQLFHAMNMNLKAGRIDLISYGRTITHYLGDAGAKERAKGGGPTQPQGYGPRGGSGTYPIEKQQIQIDRRLKKGG
jgi:outer membrane protein assembly factor BamB